MSIAVAFFDQSTPGPSGPITAWSWKFGDGNTSSTESPIHNYAVAGNYTVSLTITGTGSDGTSSYSLPIQVSDVNVSASFSSSISSLTATFTDTSAAGPSGPITAWAWDFGDGATSTSQNPVHIYSADGSYTVTLTVTGTTPDGTANVTHPVQAGASGSPQASFNDSVSGLAVTFTDASLPGPSGPITAWAWDFGDGGTSSSQNPVHTYGSAGTRTVTLTVTGSGSDGTSIATRSVVTSSGLSFISVTAWSRPSFIPTRTINFTTKTGLDSAIANMQAGDLIKYTGSGVLTISSSSTFAYTIQNKNPGGIGAKIDFGTSQSIWAPGNVSGNFVRFTNTGASSNGFASFKLSACSNIQLFGGDFTTANNSIGGIGIWATSHDILWYDFYIHNVGGSGIGVLNSTGSGGSGSIRNLTVRGEVNRWAMNPGLDSHTDKGCGEQCCIIHGANVGTGYDNCTFAIYGHDSLRPGETSAGKVWPEGGGGSVIEPGNDIGTQTNFTLYALSENNLMKPHFGVNPGSTFTNGVETGGNAINFWGSTSLAGCVVGWVESNNCTGGNTHGTSQSGWSSGTPHITVLHGRHSNCNQYYDPSRSANLNTPYDTHYSIVYNDCT